MAETHSDEQSFPLVTPGERVVNLTPAQQLELWMALNAPPRLTATQERLARLMQGEAE